MTKSKKIVCILSALLVGLVAVIMPFVLKPKQNTFALELEEIPGVEQIPPSVDPTISGSFEMPYFYMPLASYSPPSSSSINYHGVIAMSFKFLYGNGIVFDYATGRYNQAVSGNQTASFEPLDYYINTMSGSVVSSLETVNVSTLGGLSYRGSLLRYNEVVTSLDDTFIYLACRTNPTGSIIPFVMHFVTSPLDDSTFNGNVMYYNITYGWSYDNYFANYFTNYSTGNIVIVNYNYYSYNGACATISFPLFINRDVIYQQPSKNFYTSTSISQDSSYNAGYTSGYNDGNGVGYTDGYDAGNTAGFNRGQSVGYNAGYNAGVVDANNYSFLGLIGATVDAPITALTGLLNFEILGVNLSAFFFGLMTITLIIVIIKYIKGGS